MYEDDVGPTSFFLVISITLSFQVKENSNSKIFTHMGFCDPKVLAKI